MKCLLTFLFNLFILFSWSQQFSGSFYGGYQFGVGKQNLEHHSVNDFLNWEPWVWEKVDLSLGQGAQVSANLFYDINPNYGFTLNGSYLFGSEFSSRVKYTDITYERTLSGTMMRISPSFRMYVGSNKIRSYTEIGFVLGIGKINYSFSGYSGDSTILGYEYLYDGGVSFGATAKFGVEFRLTDRVQLFGEFNFISQAYAPEKGILTDYVIDNENAMHYFEDNPNGISIEFVEELQIDPTISPEPNEPVKRAKHSYPFHSYGFNVGVKFILWTKKKEESSTS
ncbi:MAG: hypothetical protein MK066_03310 [Crocinitomicaceae bacterium]|nr:hypothetical protein [Crocinitomicaceae bacterium]